jgi:hypothetical protein
VCVVVGVGRQQPGDVYWSIPSDSLKWRSSIIDSWLKQLLPLVGHSPPAGETWSGHSLRSGGASTSLAIGVNMFYIMASTCSTSCITASGSPWPRCSSTSLFMCSPARLLISSSTGCSCVTAPPSRAGYGWGLGVGGWVGGYSGACLHGSSSTVLRHTGENETLLVTTVTEVSPPSGKNMRKIHTIWYVIIPCPKMVTISYQKIDISYLPISHMLFHTCDNLFHT